jgi:hypothetical protein
MIAQVKAHCYSREEALDDVHLQLLHYHLKFGADNQVANRVSFRLNAE